jgi:hypothetical protein
MRGGADPLAGTTPKEIGQSSLLDPSRSLLISDEPELAAASSSGMSVCPCASMNSTSTCWPS